MTNSTDYSRITDYNLQTHFIDKLTDDEKKELFYNLTDSNDEIDEMDLDGKEVEWISNDLVGWLERTPNEDITFVATITFKDCVTKEFLSQFESSDYTYRVDYEENQVQFLPRYDGLIFPDDANLADYQESVPFDLKLVEHFSLGDC